MTESHRIRLRGGWEWEGADGEPAMSGRVTLPLVWTDGWPDRVRLIRWFRRPPLDEGGERLSLALDWVEGLESVQMNGADVSKPGPRSASVSISLEGFLEERNRLVLEVDVPRARRSADPSRPWGEVALVICHLPSPGELA